MKGQAINIDWTVGLSLFLLSSLSAIVILSQPTLVNTEAGMENQLIEISSNLEEETYVEGRGVNLYVRSGVEADSNIPIDRRYYFPDSTASDSGKINTSGKLDIQENRARALIRPENSTYRMTYFGERIDSSVYTNGINTDGLIANQNLSLDPESGGLNSLEVDGRELLNPDANLDFNDDSINEEEFYASTFSGNLKVYDESPEFIIENHGESTFNLKNLTTLYWYADDSTTPLTGEVDKRGETKGLTLATDIGAAHGVTFLGELDANVTKQDGSSTIEVEIETDRVRVMVHEADYQAGKERIDFYNRSDIYFGTSEKIEGAARTKIENLSTLSDDRFEEVIDLGEQGYNLTYGIPGAGNPINWALLQSISDWPGFNTGNHNMTSATRKAESGDLGIGYRNGDADTDLTEGLVGYWRMDSDVSGDGGTVEDYSGYGNDGTTSNGVSTDEEGILESSSHSFDTSSYIDIGSSNLEYHSNSTAVVVWAKPNSGGWALGHGARHRLNINSEDATWWIRSETTEWRSNQISGGNIEENNWHQVVGIFDSDSNGLQELYLNGELVADEETGGNIREGHDNQVIGGSYGSNSDFNGSIDEVRIYNRSLSEEEVRQLYFYGRDGDFNGEYTADRIDRESERNWRELEVDASVPDQTSLTAEFEVFNEFGNSLETQTFNVQDGLQNYTLQVPDSHQAEVRFSGASDNVTKSWEIATFEVYSGASLPAGRIERGSRIPLRNTFVFESESALVEADGSISSIDNRVVLWE